MKEGFREGRKQEKKRKPTRSGFDLVDRVSCSYLDELCQGHVVAAATALSGSRVNKTQVIARSIILASIVRLSL